MDESVASYVVDKLAFTLEQHLSLLSEVRDRIARLDAGAAGKASLEESLENLRSLREAIGELFDVISRNVDAMPSAYIDDVFALVGYYVEAAALGEERVLRSASRYTDVREDLERLEELRAAARIILASLNISIKL